MTAADARAPMTPEEGVKVFSMPRCAGWDDWNKKPCHRTARYSDGDGQPFFCKWHLPSDIAYREKRKALRGAAFEAFEKVRDEVLGQCRDDVILSLAHKAKKLRAEFEAVMKSGPPRWRKP